MELESSAHHAPPKVAMPHHATLPFSAAESDKNETQHSLPFCAIKKSLLLLFPGVFRSAGPTLRTHFSNPVTLTSNQPRLTTK